MPNIRATRCAAYTAGAAIYGRTGPYAQQIPLQINNLDGHDSTAYYGWHMSCYDKCQDRTSRFCEADRFMQELVVIGVKAGAALATRPNINCVCPATDIAPPT